VIETTREILDFIFLLGVVIMIVGALAFKRKEKGHK
jgi:hypothetical protein